MNYYPLLDIKQALCDAEHNLADAITYLRVLLEESHGLYPPAGAEALSTMQALRRALSQALPASLIDAMIAEQLLYELKHEGWED